MRKLFRFVGWTLLAIVIIGAYPAYRTAFGKPFSINMLANRQALLYAMRNPELFTSIGIVDGTLLDRHSGRLTAFGVAKRDSDYAFAEKLVGEVRQFQRPELSPQDQVTWDVLLDYFGSMLELRKFDWLSSEGPFPINPISGVQVQLPLFMQSQHVIGNEKTARNYVLRLVAMSEKLDAVTAEMQRQASAGVILPAALLEKSLQSIGDTVQPAAQDNPLISTFVERMDQVTDLDAQLKSDLREQAIAALTAGVYPAYQRMSNALIALRPQAAAQAAGVARLPDGAEFYALMLRQMTTSNYTPEQVHMLGLSEVQRINAQMDALLRTQGLAEGTVADRVIALGKDPRYLFPDTDVGREQVLDRYRQILAEVNARMPEYFRRVPPEGIEVERVPISAERGEAAAYYQSPALDGSRPGTFFANLRDLTETPSWAMKSLAYHEGIPGHHFQVTIAQGLKGLPLIRQQPIYTAYVEGWALYAERLAADIGMYADDPLGDLGRLQLEMFRAVRLVVDTGIHARGWTREQAIDFMVDATGMGVEKVTSEIERYMAMPGQACAYKVGQLKFLELRDRARAALGSEFSLKDFHAVVLENGAVPLTVLDTLVDAWIARGGRDGAQ